MLPLQRLRNLTRTPWESPVRESHTRLVRDRVSSNSQTPHLSVALFSPGCLKWFKNFTLLVEITTKWKKHLVSTKKEADLWCSFQRNLSQRDQVQSQNPLEFFYGQEYGCSPQGRFLESSLIFMNRGLHSPPRHIKHQRGGVPKTLTRPRRVIRPANSALYVTDTIHTQSEV